LSTKITPGEFQWTPAKPDTVISARKENKYSWASSSTSWIDERKNGIISDAELKSRVTILTELKARSSTGYSSNYSYGGSSGSWISKIRRNDSNHVPWDTGTRITYATKDSIRHIHAQSQKLIASIMPKVNVRWHIDPSIDTDYSTYDPKKKRWVVSLDPRRATFANKNDPEMQQPPTNQMAQSTVGAAIHEVSHTLYTPGESMDEWVKNFETLAVMRVFEDVYINNFVTVNRLPGARPILQSAMNWSCPPEATTESLQSYYEGPAGHPEYFEQWVNILLLTEHMAHNTAKSDITVPDQVTADIVDQVRPYTDQLMSGDHIPSAERADIYQAIADIITSKYPPQLHQEIPNIKFEIDPITGGTRTELNQQVDLGNGDTENLNELIEIPACVSGSETGSLIPEELLTHLKSLNVNLDLLEQDHLNQLEDVNYERIKEHEFQPPAPDARRVDKLAGIFKAKKSIRRMYQHGLEEGRLSQRRLHRLARATTQPYTKVFKRRPIIDTPAAAIILLVDGSGSMTGLPYNTAASCANELFLALQGNKDYVLHVWNYTGNNTVLDVKAGSLDKHNKLMFPNMLGGGTPSHLAMSKAHEFLVANYKNSNRVIVHFSDLGFGDSPANLMQPLLKDKRLSYTTIAIPVGWMASNRDWLRSSQDRFPDLKINSYPSEDLVKAIEEFILDAAQ
jgi:hypothetical protein